MAFQNELLQVRADFVPFTVQSPLYWAGMMGWGEGGRDGGGGGGGGTGGVVGGALGGRAGGGGGREWGVNIARSPLVPRPDGGQSGP
jgi:hypothetical protein